MLGTTSAPIRSVCASHLILFSRCHPQALLSDNTGGAHTITQPTSGTLLTRLLHVIGCLHTLGAQVHLMSPKYIRTRELTNLL